jgi:hypothetical protein
MVVESDNIGKAVQILLAVLLGLRVCFVLSVLLILLVPLVNFSETTERDDDINRRLRGRF